MSLRLARVDFCGGGVRIDLTYCSLPRSTSRGTEYNTYSYLRNKVFVGLDRCC